MSLQFRSMPTQARAVAQQRDRLSDLDATAPLLGVGSQIGSLTRYQSYPCLPGRIVIGRCSREQTNNVKGAG